jgi:hypothetical protein
MKIQSPDEIKHANEHFNHFHDGQFHRVEVTRGTHYMEVTNRDGSVEADEFLDGTDVNVDIIYNNYDYPNQPENRLITIKANACADVYPSLAQLVGENVFDLRFSAAEDGIACRLTYHKPDVGPVHSMENGTEVLLFIPRDIQIQESLYIPQK